MNIPPERFYDDISLAFLEWLNEKDPERKYYIYLDGTKFDRTFYISDNERFRSQKILRAKKDELSHGFQLYLLSDIAPKSGKSNIDILCNREEENQYLMGFINHLIWTYEKEKKQKKFRESFDSLNPVLKAAYLTRNSIMPYEAAQEFMLLNPQEPRFDIEEHEETTFPERWKQYEKNRFKSHNRKIFRTE